MVRRPSAEESLNRSILVFLASATVAIPGMAAVAIGPEPPSILAQCPDMPSPHLGVAPSDRAKDCTRQFCARPAYQAKVKAYTLKRPQSDTVRAEAAICISRAKQDRVVK